MGGLFNDIVAFVARADLLASLRQEVGGATGPEVQEGAILAAAAVVAGLSDWANEPSGRTWLETELPEVDGSLSQITQLSDSPEYRRFGQGLVSYLFGDGRGHVATEISSSSRLPDDAAPLVLATTAWVTAGQLAQRQTEGQPSDQLTALLHREVRDLRAAGWGPWIDEALTAPADQPRPETPAAILTGPGLPGDRPDVGSLPRRTGDEQPRSSRRYRLLGLALLLVLAAGAAALALNLLGDDEQSATANQATPTADGSDDGTSTDGDSEAGATDGASDDGAATDDGAGTEASNDADSNDNETEDDQATAGAADDAEETVTVELPEVVRYSVGLTDPQSAVDAEGTVDLALDTVSGEVCYGFEVTGMTTPFAAHIHIGPDSANGGITVDFGFLEGRDSGCVQAHPADLVAAATSPNARYIEAHDPNGGFTIRGQLLEAEPNQPTPAAPPAAAEIGDRAHAAVVDGSVVLRGVVADQATMDAFVASYSDLADRSIPVSNELRIEAGADAASDRVLVEDSVPFDFDSTEITEEAGRVLVGLAEIFKARPGWSVTALGHTDSTGSAFYNFSLSLRRAAAVQRALIDLGVEQLTVTTEAFGPLAPAADNDTEDGRAENRRIEFAIDTGN